MMNVWLYTMGSVIVVSLVSLVGIITIPLKKDKLGTVLLLLVGFAVGGLFGDAFLHLLPEAFETIHPTIVVSLCIIAGILFFLMLESFLQWRHCHNPTSHGVIHPVATLNLVGDAIHNLIDGMIIAASYLVSVPIGVATTLAVVFHEIPQEMGDFAVLIHAGITLPRALVFNFLCALFAIAGAVLTLLIGPHLERSIVFLLPFAAGGFIYIAGSDLIPELHHRCDVKFSLSLQQLAAISCGVGIMALLLFLE